MHTQLKQAVIEKFLADINLAESSDINYSTSVWNNHAVIYDDEVISKANDDDYNISFTNFNFEDDVLVNDKGIKSLRYFLENDTVIYQKIMEEFLGPAEDFGEDFEYGPIDERLEDCDIDAPDTITLAWLKTNVKLIAIKIEDDQESNEYCALELDIAVSWDDEHGMRFLIYKDRILEVAEGGYCWFPYPDLDEE